MSRGWMQQRERGSQALIRLIVWIALRLGRPAARGLLYPIALYFLVFSIASRRASRDYLSRVLDRQPGAADLFRHYHTFASVILDRVYMLAEQGDRFNVRIFGKDALTEDLANGHGCILLGSHLGSFEVLRTQAVIHAEAPFKVLMYGANAEKINAVLERINPEVSRLVIPVGRPDTLLRAKEAVDAGELLGILGDRIASDGRTVVCRFLGGKAYFPAGPLYLAGLLQVPVFIAFGLCQGDGEYDIHIERLTDVVSLDGPDKLDNVRYWTQCYADRLAHYCRQAPFNWFNFYDFWAAP